MDLNKIGLHIHELRNQFTYIEGNVSILNQSMENNAQIGVFLALQGIMHSASQISKLLWSPRKGGKARSSELRKFLSIPDDHPLNNDDIQLIFDNLNEANDEWVKRTTGQHILYDYIGDLGASQHKDVEIDKIFRSFDTKGKIYVYRGKGFNMDHLLMALKGISDAVNKAHYHLFPDQWVDTDKLNDGSKGKGDKKAAPKKKPAAKKAAPKKSTAKKDKK